MAAKKKTAKKKAATKRKTAKKRASKRARKSATARNPKASAPQVGTVIERTFKGQTYKLRVTEDGYVLGKKTFTSLTSAAKHVTKYPSVSGPRFWLGTGTQKGRSK